MVFRANGRSIESYVPGREWDWGSVQKLLSEIRPIRIEGSDPNVPILCPMEESVWASETRCLKESTEQWIIII